MGWIWLHATDASIYYAYAPARNHQAIINLMQCLFNKTFSFKLKPGNGTLAMFSQNSLFSQRFHRVI